MRTGLKITWLVLLLAVGATGCDTFQNKDDETPVPTVAALPTLDPNRPTDTPPPPPTALPPTWTAQPTPTHPRPLPTVEITKIRFTTTPFTLPTYTPSLTATLPGPLVTITQAMLNDSLTARLGPETGTLYTQTPQVTLQDKLMTITTSLPQTSGGATTIRELAIDVGLTVDFDHVVIDKPYAYFTDTNAIYAGETRDIILTAVEQVIAERLAELTDQQPFYVESVIITPDGLIVQTVVTE